MTKSEDEGRGLDHLMEQNETELDFLAAYGESSSDDGEQGEAIMQAFKRFLKAGGIPSKEHTERLEFEFGWAEVEPSGLRVMFEGEYLPLVASDLQQSGFKEGVLGDGKDKVTVLMTLWSSTQRRFVERLVEHHQSQ